MLYNTAKLRLQLLENGWSPIPNIGKACYLEGWPDVAVTPEVIDHWERRFRRFPDTGLRVENGLAVIDFDIDHEVMERVAAAVEREVPETLGALVRYGKGSKEAWFVCTTELFSRIHSHRFTAPGENVDEHGTHHVEIFGGAAARQFGAFGAHTRDGGEVKVAYEWADRSPLDVPLRELVEFDKQTFFRIVEIAERELKAAGFEQVKLSRAGESEAHREYDLTDDMVFETNEDEDGIPLAEIERRARAGDDGLRVSASFVEPGRMHSRTRCLVGLTRGGELTIWDSATGVTHMRASLAPVEHAQRQFDAEVIAARLRRLAEAEEERKTRRRAKLSPEDDHLVAAAKALQTYAYCPNQQLGVVPIWAESVADGMTMASYRTMMLPWCSVEIGPRGGEKKVNPADIWAASRDRITVEGLTLRPDQPRPIFEENGKKYINIYKPVEHPGDGGEAGGGWRLIEQLLPDERERRYFIRWLAFKWLHPGIPGPAILMVARQFGTGRGTLGELLKRMFGQRYVKTIGFDHFAGRTYQSQYTEWQADSLVVLVNESSTADNGSAYRTKHDTYERLKEIVDPRPQQRSIVAKGVKAFDALVCASYIIATNNPDALPLPEDDRRFAVLTNGEPREPAFWEEINEWMDDPANVGAFIRELEAVDLGDYSPFAPPIQTDAKAAMASMSMSDLDRAFAEAVEAMPGEVIVPEHVVNAIRELKTLNGYDLPDRWEAMARKMVQRQLYKVGERNGPGDVIYIGSRKFRTYARTSGAAKRWGTGEARREALRNGDPTQGKSPADLFSKLKIVRVD